MAAVSDGERFSRLREIPEPPALDESLYDADVLPMTGRDRRDNKPLNS
jgi:hypothetical protein